MSLKPMLPAGTLDVQQFIDSQRFSASQWLVFAICFLIMVADGFDTAAIGFVLPSLTREWGVAKLALGPVLSASLYQRFSSRGRSDVADKILSAMRAQFGGHAEVQH